MSGRGVTTPRRAARAVTVTDPMVESLSVPGRPEEAGSARAFVARAFRQRGAPDDVAVLLVSELVSNSVLHSRSRRDGGTILITVAGAGDRVRVEVTDDGAGTVPMVRPGGPEREAGRGMQLVEALSAQWGFVRHAGGTTTWFEVPAS